MFFQCLIPFAFFTLYSCYVQATSIPHNQRSIIVNFSTAELIVFDGEEVLLKTSVVLPRGNYYPLPLQGTLHHSELGPVWIPTIRTRNDNPGRYEERYGPYEAGNAMGYCKLTINFENADKYPILNYVRIHGNGYESDLGKRLSRSCIRIPDSLCETLVQITTQTKTHVTVQFVP